ncbi:MAG: hypothetical protein ACOYNF_19815 [Rhodoferax sp.]
MKLNIALLRYVTLRIDWLPVLGGLAYAVLAVMLGLPLLVWLRGVAGGLWVALPVAGLLLLGLARHRYALLGLWLGLWL